MPPRKIVTNGVAYVRSRDAARAVSLAPDYISRLARAELIDGKLIDALWFVCLASLQKFIGPSHRKRPC